MQRSDRLVWVDMEMTGLDPETCGIIEIATVITDNQLEIVAQGPSIAIHQPDELLDAMDEWNTRHHGDSGLVDRVRASTITLADAERQTFEFIRQYVVPSVSPLCGNTISQDRRFLRKYMPIVNDYLHYRLIDVSSIKEVVTRWYPEEYHAPTKSGTHLALNDILESIEELKHYRSSVFIPPPPGHISS